MADYKIEHGDFMPDLIEITVARLIAERDEAREWARKLNARIKELEKYTEADDVVIKHQMKALWDLERRYKQATCEHRVVGYLDHHLEWIDAEHVRLSPVYKQCADCGKEWRWANDTPLD